MTLNDMPGWVRESIGGGRSSRIVTNLFYLVKELGLSWSELMEMPLPTISVFIEELHKHNEAEKRELKKAQRKK